MAQGGTQGFVCICLVLVSSHDLQLTMNTHLTCFHTQHTTHSTQLAESQPAAAAVHQPLASERGWQ